MSGFNATSGLDLQLLTNPSHSPVLSRVQPRNQGCHCHTAAGPTVTSRGQCFTQTFADTTQCPSIIDSFFFSCLHFHSLPSEEWPWCFRKVWLSSVVLSFYRSESLCLVTGTLVGLGEASPLNVRIGAPALSQIGWHSHLLSLSSFPESLDTHPVSANDSTPSSPTPSQIPGLGPMYLSGSQFCWSGRR